tara:strand:+ start:2873 stop:4024 length:1152 start_codon:yes stop_codon:yes gene_type:complete
MKIFLSISILLGLLASCNTGSDPNETCDFPPGNREFTWQVDTVAIFPSTVGGVWAFGDDDAYLMGNIRFIDDPDPQFLALHWNGQEWTDEVNAENQADIAHYSNDVTGDDHFMVSVGSWSIGDEKPGLSEFDNHTKQWKGFQFQRQGALRGVWTDGKGFFMAVGDNGMVYTKDGYQADWLYSKAPTEFNFYRIEGVSKSEVYIVGYLSIPGEPVYDQLWKYTGDEWYRLYDNQNIPESILQLGSAMDPLQSGVGDVAPYRCTVTDSLELYLIANESFLLTSVDQSLNYDAINLSDLGLPLRQQGRTGLKIDLFTPNDVWIYGTRFNFYHWNGSNFQKMTIPGLPDDDQQFGSQRKMVKTKSGKVFFPTEVSSQVYVVAQGVSN